MKSESTGRNRKIKVLFISDPVEVGGASKSLIDVVSAMARRSVECTVCTSGHGSIERALDKLQIRCIADGHMAAMEVPPDSKIKRIPVFLLRSIQYKISLIKAMRIIERQIDISAIDLIHTNSARNDLGCMLAQKYHIPHIVHIREFGDADFGCWAYRMHYVEYLSSHTDRFICISNAVKDSWEKKGINPQKMQTIYNGVNDSEIVPIECDDHYLDETIKLVIVGGVCEAKGQMEAVQALAYLPMSIREKVHLDIIGWGNEEYINLMKSEINEKNLTNTVSLLGALEHVEKKLSQYHIGLMCSRAEGFGRVTAEYMHAGLGVIASKAGANKEIVTDHRTGLLYTKGNPKNLAEKIAEFYAHRDTLMDCAKRGQDYARKNYTKEINADRIYEAYINTLSEFRGNEYGTE